MDTKRSQNGRFPQIGLDPDSIIGRHPTGAVLAIGLLQDRYPLYRTVRVVLPVPKKRTKFSYWCTWIVHQARFKRGGDAYRLTQAHPEVAIWASSECASILTPEDAQDAHGISSAEWAHLVEAERAKYTA